MRRIFILSLLALAAISCSKNPTTPNPNPTSPCAINSNLMKNTIWKPYNKDTLAFANIQFTAAGDFYENGQKNGTWTTINSCDSFSVTEQGNTWNFRIVKITTDTFDFVHPVFGQILYLKK